MEPINIKDLNIKKYHCQSGQPLEKCLEKFKEENPNVVVVQVTPYFNGYSDNLVILYKNIVE